MTFTVPDVKTQYFQHKTLTRVHGQPTYATLRTIFDELKANASSVPTTLGGGLHGHLGLLLTPATYATLDPVPFVAPANPGPFVPPAHGTAAQIEAARDVWKDQHQTFAVCQAVEKALIAQIVDALDAAYLAPLHNTATGSYGDNVRNVMAHLLRTYGKISPQQVKHQEMAICNLSFDLAHPVDSIFTAIDELVELSEHANIPMTVD